MPSVITPYQNEVYLSASACPTAGPALLQFAVHAGLPVQRLLVFALLDKKPYHHA